MYWSRGLFLWMVQHKSRFRNLRQVDGTTQEFVSGGFRVCKFQSCLLAKYFISVKNCSCSHINFVQTAVEGILILCCVLVFHMSSARALDGLEYRMSLLPRDKQTCWLSKGWFQLTSSLKINPSISAVYAFGGLFLWMVQRKSRFRWVDGTTQEFVSCTFRSVNSNFCLAKYFISVNSDSCSHINFVETVEEKLRNRSLAVP